MVIFWNTILLERKTSILLRKFLKVADIFCLYGSSSRVGFITSKIVHLKWVEVFVHCYRTVMIHILVIKSLGLYSTWYHMVNLLLCYDHLCVWLTWSDCLPFSKDLESPLYDKFPKKKTNKIISFRVSEAILVKKSDCQIFVSKIFESLCKGHAENNEAKVWQNGHETWKMNTHFDVFLTINL